MHLFYILQVTRLLWEAQNMRQALCRLMDLPRAL